MLNHVIFGVGKPVLVLHGSTLDHRHMVETLEPIFEKLNGWRRIYVDMPGHGKSPPKDDIATQDDLLAAVSEFSRDVLPDQAFAIVGESRGSYIAHGMVHTNPKSVSGVALIVPGGSPTADPARLPAHSVLEVDRSIRGDMTDEEVERFDNFYVVQRRDILEKARRSKYPARALWDPKQASRINSAFDFSFHVEGETTTFDGPSLILAGRQDSMSGYLDAVDLLPQFTRATLAVLDAAGHGLAWERPEVFHSLFLDWLERVDSCF